MHRRFSATSKGETNEFEYGSLERILSRSKPITLEQRIIKLNKINIDWINYYGIAKRKGTLEQLDKTKIKNVYMETVEKG